MRMETVKSGLRLLTALLSLGLFVAGDHELAWFLLAVYGIQTFEFYADKALEGGAE